MLFALELRELFLVSLSLSFEVEQLRLEVVRLLVALVESPGIPLHQPVLPHHVTVAILAVLVVLVDLHMLPID